MQVRIPKSEVPGIHQEADQALRDIEDERIELERHGRMRLRALGLEAQIEEVREEQRHEHGRQKPQAEWGPELARHEQEQVREHDLILGVVERRDGGDGRDVFQGEHLRAQEEELERQNEHLDGGYGAEALAGGLDGFGGAGGGPGFCEGGAHLGGLGFDGIGYGCGAGGQVADALEVGEGRAWDEGGGS